jgi:hypothetical protein
MHIGSYRNIRRPLRGLTPPEISTNTSRFVLPKVL